MLPLTGKKKNTSVFMLLLLLFIVNMAIFMQVLEALPPQPLKSDDEITDQDVVVKDLKLFVEGKEFFIKGVNYSPQPLGASANPVGGMCSTKKTIYGQNEQACMYFEDYFDGVEHDNGGLPKPDGPWWQKVWERDLKVISEDLGANTIRIYHMDSLTKTLLDKFPNLYTEPKYIKKYAAVHRGFMDTAAKYGLKVVVPIVSEESILVNHSEEELKRFIEARVDEIGDHEALLMWKVGNELGLYMKPELRPIVNNCVKYVREYTMKKWNRIIPITTAEIDLPKSYKELVDELEIDIFTSNAGYRDIGLYTLWDPDVNNDFEGWTAMSKRVGIPLFIGEFGMHEQDKRTSQLPDWVNHQWRDIVDHKEEGCIGGLFFEFNEEPLKPLEQRDMGLVRFKPAVDPNTGKNSTEPGVFVPDVIEKKPVIYEALKQGLSNSNLKQYSFESDVFELTQTTQATIPVQVTKPSQSPSPSPSPQESRPAVSPSVAPAISPEDSDPNENSSPDFVRRAIIVATLAVAIVIASLFL